ncbi:DUF3515 domain-containing protein [Streptomyces sp. NPDC006984]|uniref:DUF3515 domain-containing protein n=1 Tax=unclassified Streptomyces TaxID=2593676 RepID=UPI0033FF11DD
MTSSRRRPLPVLLTAAAVLAAAVGCADGARASVAAPSPPADEAALCRALHDALPRSVAGQERRDPEPASELTAGWGDAAIVLRCGVPRPERMSDPQAQGIEVDGVGWMLEEREEGPRFTTTYRRTYVEVTLDRRYLHDASPLTDLAGPVAEAVPSAL